MTHPATLIKDSVRAYARDFRGWLLLTLPLAAIAAIFIVFDWIGWQAANGAPLFDLGNSVLSTVIIVALILLAAAAVIFVVRCFSTASIFAAYRSLSGIKPNIKESYRVGYKMFWPVLWVAVLRALIIIGGLILLIVPGIIWGLQYSLATQVAVVEGKRGREALRRSKELTKGRMLEMFIDLGVIGLIVGYGTWLIFLASIIVILALSWMLSLAAPSSAYSNINLVSGIIAIAAEAIIVWLAIPLSPLSMMAVYKDFSAK